MNAANRLSRIAASWRTRLPRASLTLVALFALLVAAPEHVWQALVWERDALGDGQLWRLWSAHAVHYGWPHALADTALLGVALWVIEREAGRATAWVLVLAGAPLIAVGLAGFAPGLARYAGASGLAALAALVAGGLLWRAVPERRGVLALLALLAGAGLMLEIAGVGIVSSLPDGVRGVWQAHALGFALGAGWLICDRRDCREVRPDLPSASRAHTDLR